MGRATKKEIVEGKDLKGLMRSIQPKDKIYALCTYQNDVYQKYHVKVFIFHRVLKEIVDITELFSEYLGLTYTTMRPIDGGEIALTFRDSHEGLIEQFGQKAFNDPKAVIYKSLSRLSNY